MPNQLKLRYMLLYGSSYSYEDSDIEYGYFFYTIRNLFNIGQSVIYINEKYPRFSPIKDFLGKLCVHVTLTDFVVDSVTGIPISVKMSIDLKNIFNPKK